MKTQNLNLKTQFNYVTGMPKPETTHITLGVTDTTGIDFSVTVLAYPSPQYELQRENGTVDNIMQKSIYMNAMNNFTLRFQKNIIYQSDFGIYHLIVSNPFGVATIFILVLPQSKISVFRFNIKENISFFHTNLDIIILFCYSIIISE